MTHPLLEDAARDSDPQKTMRQVLDAVGDREEIISQLVRASNNVFVMYILDWQQAPIHFEMQRMIRKHRRVQFDAFLEGGKTAQVMLAAPFAAISNRPLETGALLGKTSEKPGAAIDVMAEHIEHNPKYRICYPEIRVRSHLRGKLLDLQRENLGKDMDPTLRALGVDATIYGKRWTLLGSDDIVDAKNSWTENSRRKQWEIFKKDCLGRIAQYNPATDIGDRHWDVGTPFHVEDTRHQIRGTIKRYRYKKFDVEDGWWPDLIESDGKLYGFPPERIEQIREDVGELEFMRAYKCEPLSGVLQCFKPEDIEACKVHGRGDWERFEVSRRFKAGRLMVNSRPQLGQNDVVVTGLDLAISKKATADRTAFFTVCHRDGKKIPLDIRAGLGIEVGELASTVIELMNTYPGWQGIRVENNAAQDFIRQIFDDKDLMRAKGATDSHLARLEGRVIGHTTTLRGKMDIETGIRAMGVELEQQRWAIPADTGLAVHGLVKDWCSGMLAFDPTSHTNDVLMAAWLANEELRRYKSGKRRANDWEQYGIAT